MFKHDRIFHAWILTGKTHHVMPADTFGGIDPDGSCNEYLGVIQNVWFACRHALAAVAAAVLREVEVGDFIVGKFYNLFFAHSAAHSGTPGTLCTKKSRIARIGRSGLDLFGCGQGAPEGAEKTASVDLTQLLYTQVYGVKQV